MAPEKSTNDLFIGLDLGTSQCAIVTNTGCMLNIPSVVGFPKDYIARKLLGKDIVLGNECLRNRMSIDILYPLKDGVIVRDNKSEDSAREEIAARELIAFLLSKIDREEGQKVYLTVGAPAQASIEDKQAIKSAVKGLVDSVLIVSEPFLVSYGLGIYGFALIIDIGAGTLDICRMHGTLPDESDQRTFYKAGNHIDQILLELLTAKMPNARITLDMAREIKEKHAFIDTSKKQISEEFSVSGKPITYDITKEIKEGVSSIIPEMADSVRELIANFEPDYQQMLLDNIIVAGCGSRIKGLEAVLKAELAEFGKINVNIINDPVFAGAIGGLKLAQDVPSEEWEQL